MGSSGGTPLCNKRDAVVENGVETIVAPSLLVFARRSCMYLHWERKRLDDVEIASTLWKYFKAPRSLSEKRWARLIITPWACLEEVPVMMRSSTYMKRNVVLGTTKVQEELRIKASNSSLIAWHQWGIFYTWETMVGLMDSWEDRVVVVKLRFFFFG